MQSASPQTLPTYSSSDFANPKIETLSNTHYRSPDKAISALLDANELSESHNVYIYTTSG